MFFYTGDVVVLRDVANGMNATTFGMWVYIPVEDMEKVVELLVKLIQDAK